MTASAALQAVIDQMRINQAAGAESGEPPTVEGINQMMLGALAGQEVPDSAAITPVSAGGVSCEWIVDAGADTANRLLYLHGGGYVAGDLETHRILCAHLSKVGGVAILNVDYRLAPQHKCPAALEDALTAYAWMLENGPQGPGAASRSFIAGDSAGGGLTLSTLMGIRDGGLRAPDGAVTLSAWTDVTGSGSSVETRADMDPMISKGLLDWIGALVIPDGGDGRDPQLSPLFGDYSGLPPLLMQVGENEVLLDDTVVSADNARAAGVDVTVERWPDVFHVWHTLGRAVPEAAEAIDHIGAFLKEHS